MLDMLLCSLYMIKKFIPHLFYFFKRVLWVKFFIFLYILFLKILETITGEELFITRPTEELSTLKYISLLIIAPILEELVFRKWLSFEHRDITISLVFYILGCFYWFSKDIFILDAFLYYCILFLYLYPFVFKRVQQVVPKVILIITSILFGLLHYTNLADFESISFFTIFINTVPQMISGFYLCKERVEKGMINAIVLHFSLNLWYVLFSFIV